MSSEVDAAMQRLRRAARDHRAAVEELVRLGAVGSRTLVGDLGERIAAAYYGVKLEPAAARRGKGHDLLTAEGTKVEVKTLRCTPSNWRTTIGTMLGDYDVLFALRLDADYGILEAIEAPREVVESFYPRGARVTWTKTMESDDRVLHLTAEQISAGPQSSA